MELKIDRKSLVVVAVTVMALFHPHPAEVADALIQLLAAAAKK